MDVPLAAFRSIVNDRQYIDIWTSKGLERVPAPFLPYCYSRTKRPVRAVNVQEVTVRPVSKLQVEPWYRYDFATVRGVSDMSKDERPLEMAENHVAFVERVLIDQPDWFRQFKHGRPPRLMTIDIEQLTTGAGFPTEKDPLIAIGWGVDDAEPEVVLGDGKSDRDILEKFLQAVQKHDPDVLVGYNISGYDLPMIVKRLRQNQMDTRRLARGGRLGADDEEVGPIVEGRLTLEGSNSVKPDPTLHAIK